jgi:hypothetical protein
MNKKWRCGKCENDKIPEHSRRCSTKFILGAKVKVDPKILEDEDVKNNKFFFDSYEKLVKGKWEIISTVGKHHGPDAKRLNCFYDCFPIAFVDDYYLIAV